MFYAHIAAEGHSAIHVEQSRLRRTWKPASKAAWPR